MGGIEGIKAKDNETQRIDSTSKDISLWSVTVCYDVIWRGYYVKIELSHEMVVILDILSAQNLRKQNDTKNTKMV